jgi:hypothetical protein
VGRSQLCRVLDFDNSDKSEIARRRSRLFVENIRGCRRQTFVLTPRRRWLMARKTAVLKSAAQSQVQSRQHAGLYSFEIKQFETDGPFEVRARLPLSIVMLMLREFERRKFSRTAGKSEKSPAPSE